jgi:hypothetical protein
MNRPAQRLTRRLQWTLLAFFLPFGTVSAGGLRCGTVDLYESALPCGCSRSIGVMGCGLWAGKHHPLRTPVMKRHPIPKKADFPHRIVLNRSAGKSGRPSALLFLR